MFSNFFSTKAYFEFLLRHKKSIHILTIISVFISAYLSSKLELQTSFSELLPEKFENVQNLNVLSQRFGGNGLLMVGVESPDFASNKKFVQALGLKLQPLVGKDLRYFEYDFPEIRDYITKFGLHFLSTKQLIETKDKLTQQIEKKRETTFSNFLGFDEENSSSPANNSIIDNNLFENIDKSLSFIYQYKDTYQTAEEGKIVVISIKPYFGTLGIGKSKELVDKVQKLVDETNPTLFHPQMRIMLSGNIKQAVEEFEALKNGIFDTILLIIVLIGALLFLFFWSVPLLLFLTLNLSVAIFWTFAATYLGIGYLNSQTAFLASLVAGTGINYGVIFIARYLELRRKGLSSTEANIESIRNCSVPTLLASSTTAIAFLSLLYAQNKGLSHFAFIGGIGVVLCWLSAFLLLPLWLIDFEKYFGTIKIKNPLAESSKKFMLRFSVWLSMNTKFLLFLFTILTICSLWGISKILKDPIEYDFDNLRNKVVISGEAQEFRKRIHSVYPANLNPAVVLVNTSEEAKEICPTVNALKESIPQDKMMIESCIGLYNYLPQLHSSEDMKTRFLLFSEIRSILSNRLLQKSDASGLMEDFYNSMSYSPPTIQDIPEQLKRRYRELDGKEGLIAFITPKQDKRINDARNLLNFVSNIKKIHLPQSNSTVSATGDTFILADLINGLINEGPIVTLIAAFGVILWVMVLARSFRDGIIIAFVLMLAVFWMAGFQGLLGIKFNFFNFIAFPLTLGIGVDYAVNVFLRAKEEKFQNLSRILSGTGSAVILCSLTTIVGYLGLLTAVSQALIGFAQIALLGELFCLVAGIVGIPLFLKLLGILKS